MSYINYLTDAKIPINEILSATNNFSDENFIAHGRFTKVYKGQLLGSGEVINVAIRRYPLLMNQTMHNELKIIYNLKHKNVVSVVGYLEDMINVIVTRHEANGCLDKHLSSPSLMWIQRLHICVGVAHALSYIHHNMGRQDQHCLIHGNVKSSKILLDQNWEPKLSGFRYCMKIPFARRHHILLTRVYKGTPQYMDPQYEKTGGVTQKSDVFSFGIVLFEVLLGRKASSIPDDADDWYFARLARLHYEEKTLDHMIDPNLRKQMDFESLKIFSELAYFCLKEQRSHRPSIDQIVKRLERALELQRIHENPSTDEIKDVALSHLKRLNLEHLKIPLTDIHQATKNFAEAYCIGSGGYGMVYKAELDHFDGTYSSSIEGNNKGKLRKKRSTVAIKCIFSREDKQGELGFVGEIEMLSKCKHRNVISLLGFCDEGPQKILVYEHASKGSLDEHLGNKNIMTNLTWAQRIRICLEIAHGLDYLHCSTEDKKRIIHRDIKSANILLHDNWEVKIADFGLSRLHSMDHQGSTLNTCTIAGTEVYTDPEYMKTGKLKTESDIYSFGVVLFEIMCGRLAYDEIYNCGTEKGLPSVVRRCFNEGTLKQMVDPKLVEVVDENVFTRYSGLNEDSFHTFIEVAYRCLAETQSERPKMEVIIKELEKALYLQENSKDNLQISLENIRLATENFSEKYFRGKGLSWIEYVGRVPNANGLTNVLIKRFIKNKDGAEHGFMAELEILLEYKHDNIISLVGYCNEEDEKIILYEFASRGSLSMHLKDASVNWIKRLKLCIDVASGLDFIHGGNVTQQQVIHRHINSCNIIVNEDWIAKISNFDGSLLTVMDEELDYGYHDDDSRSFRRFSMCLMLKMNQAVLKRSGIHPDIYSLGVVLCEIMSGISEIQYKQDKHESFGDLARKRKLDKIVFEGIKEQIVPQSLTTFQRIAIRCLKSNPKHRLAAGAVVIELKKALEFQEDYEIWEPKLPKDYKDIFRMSETPDICSTEKRKNLYDILTKGILLQKGTVLFSLGSNGERNEMISATKFSYKNRWSHKWRSIPGSRFQKVTEMLDISNLKIQIRTRTQFLSPGVNYRVHLVFKFCGPRKSQAKRMYVNLKYKRGNENLNAYFATWREDEWMMIELFRFLSNTENTDFEVQLESFSRCYCGSRAVYIQGIEFQAVYDVKHEETEKLNEIGGFFRSNSNTQQVQLVSTIYEEGSSGSKNYDDDGEKLSLPSEVIRRKCHILPATEFLYDTSNVKLTNSKQFQDSSFLEMIELPSQQVFRIKCKIQSQMLSPDTEYDCYLVFKLLEKGCKLHCPVIVRILPRRRRKEAGILYFRSPSDLNQHDFTQIPKERKDGWIEVKVLKFNSNHDLKNDCLHVNLKLISYEGTMSGVIVRGLEFRPS